MKRSDYGPSGMIKKYENNSWILPGTVILRPNEEALKTGFFGDIKEVKAGTYVLGPKSSLIIVDKRDRPLDLKTTVTAGDNFPLTFDIHIIYKPKNINEIITKSPENFDETIKGLIESEALNAVYGQNDMKQLLANRAKIENGINGYIKNVLEGWGFEIYQLRTGMKSPKEIAQSKFNQEVLVPKIDLTKKQKELAEAEGNLSITETAFATESEAMKRRILGELDIELKKKRGLAEVEVAKAYMTDVKLPTLQRQYELAGELLKRVAEAYGDNAPQVIWATTLNSFGQEHPVTQAIAEQIGMSYKGQDLSNFSEKSGVSPNAILWANVFKNANLFNIGDIGELINRFADFDSRLKDKLYGSKK
ncbi:MAG: SPFH domain-containing protein [Methanotrichaceae archaeon]|jgi:hypothetical protein